MDTLIDYTKKSLINIRDDILVLEQESETIEELKTVYTETEQLNTDIGDKNTSLQTPTNTIYNTSEANKDRSELIVSQS